MKINSGGSSSANLIQLDLNAAGHGWFMDVTPHEDEEFAATPLTQELRASAASPASGRVDLLTAVMHEMGHILGHGHSHDDLALMAKSRKPGVRRAQAVDVALADERNRWSFGIAQLGGAI